MELLSYVLAQSETGLLAFIAGFGMAVVVGGMLVLAVKS